MKAGELPWTRILTEGLVIVLSILLAFAIDAWWQDRVEQEQQREHLLSMRAEFESSIAGLEEVITSIKYHGKNIDTLISMVKSVPENESINIPGELMGSVVTWRTSDVSTSTLDALMASGNLNLLTNVELRKELASFPAFLLNITEDELLAQQFAVFEMTKILAREGLLEIAYAYRQGVQESELITLAAPVSIDVKHTPELVGMLTTRRVHTYYSDLQLPSIQEYLSRLIEMIDIELKK